MPATDFSLSTTQRILIGCFALLVLGAVFLFQQVDFLSWLVSKEDHPNSHFAAMRLVRVLINDVSMLLLLMAWFNSRSVIKLAFAIQLIDLFILLPLYLGFKLYSEGNSEISSPLLSQFHRLIVNPTLMILLIPAVYFQRYYNK